MKTSNMKRGQIISITLCLAVVLLGLIGCHSRTWVDAWRPTPILKGLAWHNEACQQTAYDIDSDGRIDRLRFWFGSGLAEELIDGDFDGWFDSHVVIVYGKDRERKQIHTQAPAVPVTNTPGAFKRPEAQTTEPNQSPPTSTAVTECAPSRTSCDHV